MCCRISLKKSDKDVASRFLIELEDKINKRNNEIRPNDFSPAIIQRSIRELDYAKWGILPYKTQDKPNIKRIINARKESLLIKPTFKNLIACNRCIIPADSYFEWQKLGSKKIKHRISIRNSEIFGIAALYSEEILQCGEKIISFVVITMEPNRAISAIHDRMPAILNLEAEEYWLNGSNSPVSAIDCLMPIEDESAIIIEPCAKTVDNCDTPSLF